MEESRAGREAPGETGQPPEPVHPSALLRQAASRLARVEAGNPRLEAEYLLAAALELDRSRIFLLPPDAPVPSEARRRFEILIERREGREPLQYILGTVPFCGLDLAVGPGVLIPRGETEVLVERVARALAEPAGAETGGSGGPPGPLLVDAGTGSGAILLALLARLPRWRGIGVDRSSEALAWARRNGGAGGARLLWVRGDLLQALPDAAAQAIVSNPPYIRTGEIDALAPEIRDYEPRLALDGGDTGLTVFARLAAEAKRVLAPGGLFGVELGADQPREAAEILAATGGFAAADLFDDLAGRSRGLLARRL